MRSRRPDPANPSDPIARLQSPAGERKKKEREREREREREMAFVLKRKKQEKKMLQMISKETINRL
jgi:hypothetical protein